MANNNWKGKTVWLTGASSGIGRILAIKLAKLGCTVVISARREEALKEVAKHAPQQILPLVFDVADDSQRDKICKELADRVEAIDIALFVAGVVEYEDDLSFDIERYRKVFDVNFFGLLNSVAIAMPLLKKSEFKPYIVGVTSLTVLTGFPRAEIYGSSKAAADYFLKALRMDLDPEKFDLSIVRPGFVETPMTSVNDFPMPFIMSADEAADRIIDGMNKRKLFINFPRRFSFLLKLLSSVSSIWYKILGPKMNRHQNK